MSQFESAQPNPYASPGFVEAQQQLNPAPTYGRVLRRTGEVLLGVWPTLLGALLLLCLPWQLGVSYYDYHYLSEDVPSIMILSLLSSVGQLSLILLANTIVIAACWQALQKQEQDIPAIVRRGLMGFVYVFPSMFISLVAISFAVLACLIPGIYLNIRWMYILPIAVVEGRGGVSPLQRSWQLTNTHQMFSAVMFLIFCAPMVVVMVLTALPSEFLPEFDNWAIDAMLTTVNDLVTLIVCCGFTCTYYELLKSQTEPAKIMPEDPELVAAAFAERPRFGE
ncbi:glycerophosphoryl diester phosphodiesterase membrane domain-containing protein [Anatilimnocola sp. NA78]|uniref:glycerophosphoryl diester phosphodiesterase membrane domain-containing protein n=1 Tax=Anatilimnocola sp. NA78 TaxID=3415683 RepID=UPI003CE5029E